MAKVICTLPNASGRINGIQFVTHAKGMISEEMPDETAKGLASIPGFHLVEKPQPADKKGKTASPGQEPAADQDAEGNQQPAATDPAA